jgi:hypothetical protein
MKVSQSQNNFFTEFSNLLEIHLEVFTLFGLKTQTKMLSFFFLRNQNNALVLFNRKNTVNQWLEIY